MNKIKKALALLISVLMIFTLSSCALHFNFPKGEPEETEGEETTADTAVTDPEKPDYVLIENDFTSVVTKHLASIGKADFEGSTVMIATPKASLISEDECGLVMADMVSMRNGLVEDKFNISIYAKSVDADTMFTEVSNAERAGDYYADMTEIALLDQTHERLYETVVGGNLRGECNEDIFGIIWEEYSAVREGVRTLSEAIDLIIRRAEIKLAE